MSVSLKLIFKWLMCHLNVTSLEMNVVPGTAVSVIKPQCVLVGSSNTPVLRNHLGIVLKYKSLIQWFCRLLCVLQAPRDSAPCVPWTTFWVAIDSQEHQGERFCGMGRWCCTGLCAGLLFSSLPGLRELVLSYTAIRLQISCLSKLMTFAWFVHAYSKD